MHRISARAYAVAFGLLIFALIAASQLDLVGAQGPSDSTTYLPLVASGPSPTPTATATPTATPLPPPPVQILNNHGVWDGGYGWWHIVGEVQNNTSGGIEGVKIPVVLYNGGLIVDTDYAYIPLDTLPPGNKTCFDISMLSAPTFTDYQFEAPTYRAASHGPVNLTLLNLNGYLDTTHDWYSVAGQVRNDSARTVRYVQPVATLYGYYGQVVGCDYTYVSSTDLAPGQTSAFSMDIDGPFDSAPVGWYRVQVDGTPQ